MGKTKVECKKLDFLTGSQKCLFCNTSELDETKYGPIYMHKNVITHYYCLLLSSNMEQNGKDSEGILGFLTADITKEVKRGVRLYCSYCRSGGATLGCAIAKCKVVFHLPCGMKHGTLHQFFGEFKSYCAKHRPVQRISEKILADSSKGDTMCGICYEKVVPRPIHETLWAPCCQKSAFFHRDCVQKLATSAGYFFKCPLCNNTDTFQRAMKDFGIYIPEQDASWECVPQAYQDLLVRHETCDSINCSCPSGRTTDIQGTRWELILCKYCGSQGIHIGCGRLKWKCPEFVCDSCSPRSETEGNAQNGNGDRHRLSGRRTADIHPSVSADREGELTASDSSNDSENFTISNRRKKVVSPIPYVERDKPAPKRKPSFDKAEKKPVKRCSDDNSRPEMKPLDPSIIIDDSDDDVEIVNDTSEHGCLKTKDGSTIPVVQMKNKSIQKRLRVEGDVQVLPEEIVDITIKMNGPPKKLKPAPSPPVKELVFSLPQPLPSTSAALSMPSTSFAPPDLSRNQFVLVDPATLRPEDLPPGTLLYRSVQPLHQPQQMQTNHPQNNLPMQQLGSAGHADAKYSDFSEHWPWGSHHLDSLHLSRCAKKASRKVKRDSARRRRRRQPVPGCDYDRLISSRVLLTPLKFRISPEGHLEIGLQRKHLGFGSMKQKVSSKLKTSALPSHPLKKKRGRPKNNPSLHASVIAHSEILSNGAQKSLITQFFNPLQIKCKRKLKKKSTNQKAEIVSETTDIGKPSNKTPRNKRSPKKTSLGSKLRNKSVFLLEQWKFKKIEEYLKVSEKKSKVHHNTQGMTTNSNLAQISEENMTIRSFIDEIIEDLVVKQDEQMVCDKITNDNLQHCTGLETHLTCYDVQIGSETIVENIGQKRAALPSEPGTVRIPENQISSNEMPFPEESLLHNNKTECFKDMDVDMCSEVQSGSKVVDQSILQEKVTTPNEPETVRISENQIFSNDMPFLEESLLHNNKTECFKDMDVDMCSGVQSGSEIVEVNILQEKVTASKPETARIQENHKYAHKIIFPKESIIDNNNPLLDIKCNADIKYTDTTENKLVINVNTTDEREKLIKTQDNLGSNVNPTVLTEALNETVKEIIYHTSMVSELKYMPPHSTKPIHDHCRKPTKQCGNAIFGLFPKIKMKNHSIVEIKTSRFNEVKKFKKVQNESNSESLGQRCKRKRVMEHNVVKKAKTHAAEKTCVGRGTNMSVIDHYFTPIKGDLSKTNNTSFVNDLTEMASNNCLGVGKQEEYSHSFSPTVEQTSYNNHATKMSSSEKKPLIELKLNIIPNLFNTS